MYELVALRATLKDLQRKLEWEIVEKMDLHEACKVYEQIKHVNQLIEDRKKSIRVQFELN
ncbi:MAG TPA: hypothetical protein VM101_12360 [Flavitalea sp.]|nr:hypothetical protein [Flavitalea sp.]